jgi:hypothetical protein
MRIIGGSEMNITRYNNRYYKEVARKAKVGEIIRLLVGQGDVEKDDILQIVDAKEWGNKLPRYRDASGCYLENDEYVVLEPLTVMTDAPHPEIAEGSTFVVVDDRDSAGAVSTGDVVTLTNNDGTKVPHFDSDEKLLLWRRLSPLNIIYKDAPKQETVTIYGYNDSGSPVAEAVPVPGVSKTKFKSINPKPTVCPTCGQPLPQKRVYTAEQIREAKDIVYRIVASATPDKAYAFDRRGNRTLCRLLSNEGNKTWVEIGCNRAKCSPNAEWQDDVRKCVAICKLTGEPMPKWILKDGE